MQGSIESPQQVFRRNTGLENEAGYLGNGVHTGVGASRALGQRRFAGDAVEGSLEFALDSGIPRLYLPAVKIGAVVSEGELPGLRSGAGFVQVIQGFSL